MIILDAGHGINTPGKRSPVWSDGSQLLEYEFNRSIVNLIHKDLLSKGIESTIIVKEAIDVSLRARVGRANRIFEQDRSSFLISVHGNAGEKPNQGTGWEVWTTPYETESDKLATRLFLSAKQFLPQFTMRSDFVDGDPDKESKFYILSKTDCPAVLTENLFYDNEKDCRFMMSETGRYLIAKLHVDAIIKYNLKLLI